MKRSIRPWFAAFAVLLAWTVAMVPAASSEEKSAPAVQAPAAPAKAPEAKPAAPAPAAAPAPKPEPVSVIKAVEHKKIPQAGDAFVDIEGAGKDGKPVKLSSLMGKKTVVVFAQSACNTCVAEGELMSALFEDKKDVTVVFVMVDMGGPDSAKRLVDKLKLDAWAKVMYDPKFATGPDYGFYVTPATALIKDGNLVKLHQGFNPNDQEFPKLLSSF